VSWFRPASGCSCVGSRIKSEGFWMALLGSKGVGVKLSWGSWVGAAAGGGVDFRPVSVSQLKIY
jgi:hypothetical protein